MPKEVMNFSVDASIKKRAKARRDVNWSAVVSQAILDKLDALELAEELARKAKFHKKDALQIARKIDEAFMQSLRDED